MLINSVSIPKCYEIEINEYEDERGIFVKTYQEKLFQRLQFKSSFVEQYYSVSYKGVLRGLHFQLPPMEHSKLIHLIKGEILDVVVDLRRGSPTYGKYHMFHLNGANKKIVFIPEGLAHGFYVLSDKAILLYNVTSVYSKEYDSGINWSSLDIKWPDSAPIISDKDSKLIDFNSFSSPFYFNKDD